jgi:hypothetical protein
MDLRKGWNELHSSGFDDDGFGFYNQRAVYFTSFVRIRNVFSVLRSMVRGERGGYLKGFVCMNRALALAF